MSWSGALGVEVEHPRVGVESPGVGAESLGVRAEGPVGGRPGSARALGRVMGTEEASARLREQVARQTEEFSTLENFHVDTYLFYFLSCWFFPSAYF